MKPTSYKDIVAHYGYDLCDGENNCVVSPSGHKRGQITHWRTDTLHWVTNRRITKPGLVQLLRVIASDKDPSMLGGWMVAMARRCMWAQQELQTAWDMTLPANAFRKEKQYLVNYYYKHKKDGNKMTMEDYTSPMYAWAHTLEEK